MASKYSRKDGFVRDADGKKKKIAEAEAKLKAAKSDSTEPETPPKTPTKK